MPGDRGIQGGCDDAAELLIISTGPARSVLPLGPPYFPQLPAPQKPAYLGPYNDQSKNLMG
jgi:hypothetical protein